jgi:hypothetical protein
MGFIIHSLSRCRIVLFPAIKTGGLGWGLPLLICAGVLLLIGATGCSLLPGTAVDGYASAQVETWYDRDGDGQIDADESPLPWVTIQMAYEQSMTDSEGQGTVGVFKPGCVRRCWRGETVSVLVPPGFRATTPTEVDLTGQEGSYAFGLQPEAGVDLVSSPDEPDWASAFHNRGLDLVELRYDDGDSRLELTLETGDSPGDNALYRDIFGVIELLRGIKGVSVEWLEVTSLPSNQVSVCDMSEVEAWMGKISSAEIIAAYCKSP